MQFEDGSETGYFVAVDTGKPGGDRTVVALIAKGKIVYQGPCITVVRHKSCGAVIFMVKAVWTPIGGLLPLSKNVIWHDGTQPLPGTKIPTKCPSCLGMWMGSKFVEAEIIGSVDSQGSQA